MKHFLLIFLFFLIFIPSVLGATPSIPENFGVNISDTTVNISWDESTDAENDTIVYNWVLVNSTGYENITHTVRNESMMLYTHFNDGTSTDWSLYGNTGTIYNGTWEASEHGGGLGFDGTTSYVNCWNGSSFDITDEITISIWVKKLSGGSGDRTLLNKGNRYQISYADTTIHFGIHDPDADQADVYGRVVLPVIAMPSLENEMHFVTCSYSLNDRTLRVYLDGIEQDTLVSTGGDGKISIDGSNLLIGKFGSKYFNGLIDDLRIYNRALSATELNANYNIIAESASYDNFTGTISNLSCGDYHIIVNARDNSTYSEWSEIYNFSILPPIGTFKATFKIIDQYRSDLVYNAYINGTYITDFNITDAYFINTTNDTSITLTASKNYFDISNVNNVRHFIIGILGFVLFAAFIYMAFKIGRGR